MRTESQRLRIEAARMKAEADALDHEPWTDEQWDTFNAGDRDRWGDFQMRNLEMWNALVASQREHAHFYAQRCDTLAKEARYWKARALRAEAAAKDPAQ